MSTLIESPSSAQDLIKLGRPSDIKDIPKNKALALFDLDGTLTEPGSELLIETFLREVVIGSTRVREELMNRFEQWSKSRRTGNPNYEGYLRDVGNLWAKMLYEDDTGKRISRKTVVETAEKWFRSTGVRDIQEYCDPVITAMKANLFRPVMVTGAPFELAIHYANALGINHVFAMDAEVDSDMCYTTKMRFPANTGIGANKAEVCRKIIGHQHRVGFAMGDTKSDAVLFDTAINLKHYNDMHGAAFLINPRAEVLNDIRATMGHFIDDGDLEIVPQTFTKRNIMRRVRHQISDTLERNDMKDGEDFKTAA
jgi:phosphoserine phosphatase